MNSNDRLQAILAEFRERLEEMLGNELDSVILYGSQARGDAEEGSDIDVLCVLKGPFDYGDMILRTSEASAELSLKHDVVISTAFVARADYESRKTPFLMNVRREGVVYQTCDATQGRQVEEGVHLRTCGANSPTSWEERRSTSACARTTRASAYRRGSRRLTLLRRNARVLNESRRFFALQPHEFGLFSLAALTRLLLDITHRIE